MLRSILTSFFVLIGISGFASHVPGGYITTECVGPNQYVVTLTIFEDCATAFINQQDQTIQIANSCGFSQPTSANLPNVLYQEEVSQVCQSECQGGPYPGVFMHQWSDTLTLPGVCNDWSFQYSLCCLNTSTNVQGQPGYYWNNDVSSANASCNSSAYPERPGTGLACIGFNESVNFEFVDPDGDSLDFSLVTAQSGPGNPVTYNAGYSGGQPIPGVTINSTTGELNFTTNTAGNYVVNIQVDEYRNGVLINSFVYYTQIDVVNCSNTPPTSSGISNITGASSFSGNNIYTCGSTTVCFDVDFSDVNSGDVLTTGITSGALQGVTISQSGMNPAVATVCIPPQSLSGSFLLHVTASDTVCPLPGSASEVVILHLKPASIFPTPNQVICGGNSATLNPGGNFDVNWSVISGDPINVGTNFSCNPCASPAASPLVTTTYVGQVVDSCGNNVYDTVTVQVTSSVSVALPDSIVQCGESLIDPVVSPSSASLTWLDTGGQVISNDSAIWNSIFPYGEHTVYLIGSGGACSDSDTVVVSNYLLDLQVQASDTLLCGGNLATVTASTPIDSAFYDDFDDCPDMSLWSQVNNGNCGAQGCGTASGTGDALYFDGAAGTRSIVTVPVNTTNCTQINLCLFLGNDISTPAPCENIESGENVFLQYSDNGGASWNIMQIFDEADWDTGGPYEDSWACFNVSIPPAAVGTGMIFRLIQPNYSGCAGCDNWSLDDFSISCSGNNIEYAWTGSGLTDTTGYVTTVDPVGAGMAYVTITDQNTGCTATDSVNIQNSTGLPVDLVLFDSTTCTGEWVGSQAIPTAMACPDCQYTWSANAFGGSPDSRFTLATFNDTVFVEVTDNGSGCTGSDTAIIYTDSLSLEVYPMVDTVCYNGVAAFTASATGVLPDSTHTYDWMDLSTGGTIIVNDDSLGYVYTMAQSGSIELNVYGDTAYGCFESQVMQVALIYPDTASLGNITGQTTVVQNSGWMYTGNYSSSWTNPQWIVSGGTIASGQGTGAISVSWGTGSSGMVQLVLEDVNGCGYDTLSLNVSILPVSIDEYADGTIRVYPNPATNQLTITGLDNLESENPLWVLDITGRQVMSIDPSNDQITVDVSSLEPGIYTILTSEQSSLTRFVINR